MRLPTPLERRRDAVQALLAEYKGREFSWEKSVHCVRIAAVHLRRMGYRTPIARGGYYRSALSARRALDKAGFASLAAALDAMGLPRIAPAAALPGDIIELPGEPPFGALAVACGMGRVLGFHEDIAHADILQPSDYVSAWRVDPR